MGQKTNPIGNRLGFIRGWDSQWYGGKKFADKLVEDHKIREYVYARLKNASVSHIVISRTLKLVSVTINTARPGIIIGKGGQEVDKLKEELKKLTKKEVQINIYEIKRPELDAKLVADSIARQIEGRISFRRAAKMSIASTMRMGAEGIKIQVGGRLGGADMARSENGPSIKEPVHISAMLSEAVNTIPENLAKVNNMWGDPLGLSIGDLTNEQTSAEAQEVELTTIVLMQQLFDGQLGAFCYILFVLLYMPCVATLGAIYKEAGGAWAFFSATWNTLLAYSVAVIVYQLGTLPAHPQQSLLWTGAMLLIMFVG